MINTNYSNLYNSIACLPEGKYAIAVSGGSDSLALLYLMNQKKFAGSIVVHFDHNVRKESADEASFVEKHAKLLGFEFKKQVWKNPKSELGNFYQQARKKRYSFFKQVVDKYKLNGVVVAHSQTDLVETLLMRLSKGASLQSITIFQENNEIFGVRVLRPLINHSREELQNFLTENNLNWKSDPSNNDQNKQRPRIRNILPQLQNAGINFDSINSACNYFSQANNAINYYLQQELKKFNYNNLGFYSIELDSFMQMPLEIQIRIINYISNIFGEQYAHVPRRKKTIEMLTRLKNKNNICEISSLRFEIINKVLFIMPIFVAKNKKLIEIVDINRYNIIYLQDMDKQLRYTISRKYNLQLLPINIRNVVPFKVLKNVYLANLKEPDIKILQRLTIK